MTKVNIPLQTTYTPEKRLEVLIVQKDLLQQIIHSRQRIVNTRMGNTPEWNQKLYNSKVDMVSLDRQIDNLRAEIKHAQYQIIGNP